MRARDREPKRDARGGEMCVEVAGVAIMKAKGWAMKGREMGTHSSTSSSDVQLTLYLLINCIPSFAVLIKNKFCVIKFLTT